MTIKITTDNCNPSESHVVCVLMSACAMWCEKAAKWVSDEAQAQGAQCWPRARDNAGPDLVPLSWSESTECQWRLRHKNNASYQCSPVITANERPWWANQQWKWHYSIYWPELLIPRTTCRLAPVSAAQSKSMFYWSNFINILCSVMNV